MTRGLLAATIAVLLAAPTTASAAELTITMPGKYFSPARTTAVVGDTVRWRNADRATHAIRGTGIESGLLPPGAQYAQRFEAIGVHPFVCPLHPFMSGQLDVVEALLEPSADEVLAGAMVELRGRVPAGAGPVTIERVRDGGTEKVATVTPQADGSFSSTVTPSESSSYRAVSAAAVSPAVEVHVVSGLSAHLNVSRGEHFSRVRVSVRPVPQGDFTAALELYSRERFSWRRAAHTKLDRAGRALFRLRAGMRRRARVVLLSDSGAEVAVSQSVRLWRAGREMRETPRPHVEDTSPEGEGGHGA